jgi:hypothetical protein
MPVEERSFSPHRHAALRMVTNKFEIFGAADLFILLGHRNHGGVSS